MNEGIAAPVNVPSLKGGTAKFRKLETLEKARGQLAKLLRARIAEGERELEALREEFSSISGHAKVRRTQACSACGKAGHTKRTCPERGKKESG